MNPLKKVWIKHLTKKHENRRAQANSVDFGKSKKIGLLFFENPKENLDVIDNIMDDLKVEGKEIVTLALCKNKKHSLQKYPIFEFGDIDFFGTIKSSIVNDFINQDFDFLVCLDKNPNTVMNYLLSRLNAKCRLGIRAEHENEHYEFILKKEEGLAIKSSDILKYLKMIKSNEH